MNIFKNFILRKLFLEVKKKEKKFVTLAANSVKYLHPLSAILESAGNFAVTADSVKW